MKSNRINYIIVGLFVLMMIAGLMTSLAFLTGRTGSLDSYYAVYNNVTGVKFGSQVVYEGYPIGQVDAITPMEEKGRMRFRVDFSITEGWRIPDNSLAEIAAPGLLAAVTIAISAGDSAKSLKPGGEIAASEASDIMSVVSGVAAEVQDLTSKELKPLLGNVNHIVDTLSIMLEGEGQGLVRDISALLAELSARAPEILANIEDVTQKLDGSSDQIAALLSDKNRAVVERFLGNLETASVDVVGVTSEFDATRRKIDHLLLTLDEMVVDNRIDVEKAIIELRYVIGSFSRHIDTTNHNLEATARNMYEFSRQIRQNPGLLLSGRAPEDKAAKTQ